MTNVVTFGRATTDESTEEELVAESLEIANTWSKLPVVYQASDTQHGSDKPFRRTLDASRYSIEATEAAPDYSY